MKLNHRRDSLEAARGNGPWIATLHQMYNQQLVELFDRIKILDQFHNMTLMVDINDVLVSRGGKELSLW